MRKRITSKKGMTLIEVIISLAIFTILGVILITVGSVVDTTTRASNRLNKKVNIQAPYAASQRTVYVDPVTPYVDDGSGNLILNEKELKDSSLEIDVSIDDISGSPVNVDVKYKKSDGTFEDRNESASITIGAKEYDTITLVYNEGDPADDDDDYIDSSVYEKGGANEKLNLKFAVLDNKIAETIYLVEGDTYQLTDAYGYELEKMDTEWKVSTDDPLGPAATVSPKGLITASSSVSTSRTVLITGAKNGLYYEYTVNVDPVTP